MNVDEHIRQALEYHKAGDFAKAETAYNTVLSARQQRLSLTDRSIREEKALPCAQLWTGLTFDVEGRVYPCCLALWAKANPLLMLGNAEDSVADWNRNLVAVRRRHLLGEFGACRQCAYLYDERKACSENYRKLQEAYTSSVELMAHNKKGII